jgi:hypothetical protein
LRLSEEQIEAIARATLHAIEKQKKLHNITKTQENITKTQEKKI